MDRNESENYLYKMHTPLKTRYLMFNSWNDYKISEKVRPGYLYYLAIPGYISDYEVGKAIHDHDIYAITNLVERMNKEEGHTGLRWKNYLWQKKKYREPPWYVFRDEYDDRVSIY